MSLCDLVHHKQRLEKLGHDDCVLSVVFSPDGIHVVSSGFDHEARIWKLELRWKSFQISNDVTVRSQNVGFGQCIIQT